MKTAHYWTHLQDFLYTSSSVIVIVSYDVWIHDTGGGIEGIHGRVDSQLGNATGQDSGGVQVGESRGRGRIGQIVSRYINGLKTIFNASLISYKSSVHSRQSSYRILKVGFTDFT